MIIGILALQGAFEEHEKIFNKISPTIKTILIKKKEDVEVCDGIILPGGESTSYDAAWHGWRFCWFGYFQKRGPRKKSESDCGGCYSLQ